MIIYVSSALGSRHCFWRSICNEADKIPAPMPLAWSNALSLLFPQLSSTPSAQALVIYQSLPTAFTLRTFLNLSCLKLAREAHLWKFQSFSWSSWECLWLPKDHKSSRPKRICSQNWNKQIEYWIMGFQIQLKVPWLCWGHWPEDLPCR